MTYALPQIVTKPRRQWPLSALVVFLCLMPLAIGLGRFVSLSEPATEIDQITERLHGSYLVLKLHIVTGVIFAWIAAFQFLPRPRRRALTRHKWLGRFGAATALVSALSGAWLIIGYPMSPLASTLGNGARLVAALGLVLCLVLGIRAARARDSVRHRAWMFRAFALSVAGSTQGVVIGVWYLATGRFEATTIGVLLTLGFVINLAGAEYLIRRLPRF